MLELCSPSSLTSLFHSIKPMKVINIHERELEASHEKAGALIDSLSSPSDSLWPRQSWPPMHFDRPLAVGATGGHGPIRYRVESYTPGQSVKFRFLEPKGFDGYHCFEIAHVSERSCVLRHTIEMTTHGLACFTWMLIIRPLHDALLEDALDVAQASLGLIPQKHTWSLRVRFLRWMLAKRRTRKQKPAKSPP
jgi:hypothetical protein